MKIYVNFILLFILVNYNEFIWYILFILILFCLKFYYNVVIINI